MSYFRGKLAVCFREGILTPLLKFKHFVPKIAMFEAGNTCSKSHRFTADHFSSDLFGRSSCDLCGETTLWNDVRRCFYGTCLTHNPKTTGAEGSCDHKGIIDLHFYLIIFQSQIDSKGCQFTIP